MNIDQLTDIAFEVASELEPTYSIDVFDVSESQIIFNGDRGLFKICLPCLNEADGFLKGQIKNSLMLRLAK